ncbi:MAG: hypothetical protein JWP26_4274 [Devosia sp.]|uniref:peptidase inhibitor family I36 protein n=1 Tax=Devosia sp. TaxID=1871048 RepID=UPI0026397DA6|nr:peptidase inhibitor family I36 protein [Devosia sp.]MDB5537862.1 hypothetical protein [Devosia sp.]MDB5589304.1 hypothetical protein [Devosia sp.]
MVLRTRQILLALIAPLVLLFAVAPAMAEGPGYGTPAWSTQDLTLRQGPGGPYDVVGAIAADQAILVYRCTVRWCVVGQGHERGWAQISKLSFGLSSAGPLSGPRLNYGHGGPGQICFFEGRNYTGASVCMTSGNVYNDLLLSHLDNRFSSVTVEGHVSAAVCRDADFQSYCTRIIKSEPVLGRYLNDAVSSIRVY